MRHFSSGNFLQFGVELQVLHWDMDTQINELTLKACLSAETFLDQYLTQTFYLFSNEVLNMSEDISEVGEVQTDLFCFLILAWIIVYGVIWKGLHNSGKVKEHPCTENA